MRKTVIILSKDSQLLGLFYEHNIHLYQTLEGASEKVRNLKDKVDAFVLDIPHLDENSIRKTGREYNFPIINSYGMSDKINARNIVSKL